jgi:hypothetical protein
VRYAEFVDVAVEGISDADHVPADARRCAACGDEASGTG